MSGLLRRLQSGRLGRILVYGSSRSVVEATIGLRGILLAVVLGPVSFGVWALFRLIFTYSNFAGLGLLRGLELEVAKGTAKHDHSSREAWGRTAAGCVLLIYGSIAALLLGASALVTEPWLRELLWAVAAGLLLQRLWGYGLTFMRASGSFREFALLEIFQAMAQLILTLALGYLFGLSGAFAGFTLAILGTLMLLRGRAPLRPELNWPRLKSMLAVGLPLSMSQFLSAMLATVDRLVVGAWLGLAALGQYAFGVSVASVGLSAALVVQTVVFPDVYGRLEREGVTAITREHLERTIRPFVLVLSPLAGAGVIGLSVIVTRLLPQYEAAMQPAAVFVFTGIASGVNSLAMVAVVASSRQSVLPLFTLAALAVNAGLACATLALGFGMVALASGAVVARLLYAAGVVMLIAHSAGIAPLRAAMRVLWPVAWCIVATALVSSLVPPRDLASCIIALSWYLVAVSPVVLAFGRNWRQRLLLIKH